MHGICWLIISTTLFGMIYFADAADKNHIFSMLQKFVDDGLSEMADKLKCDENDLKKEKEAIEACDLIGSMTGKLAYLLQNEKKLTKSEINGILMEVYGMVEKNYNDSRAQIERELDEVAPERKETIQAAVEKWMQENIYGKKSKNLDKIFLEHVKALAAKGKKAFLPRNGKAITKHGLGDQSPEQLATEYELSLLFGKFKDHIMTRPVNGNTKRQLNPFSRAVLRKKRTYNSYSEDSGGLISGIVFYFFGGIIMIVGFIVLQILISFLDLIKFVLYFGTCGCFFEFCGTTHIARALWPPENM